jgi:hypothetical protein
MLDDKRDLRFIGEEIFRLPSSCMIKGIIMLGPHYAKMSERSNICDSILIPCIKDNSIPLNLSLEQGIKLFNIVLGIKFIDGVSENSFYRLLELLNSARV